MREGQKKISSIEFSSEGCVLNGEKPIPVVMPADVAPPGSMDNPKAKKPEGSAEPTEGEKMEERALQLARLINHRREKSNRTIKEV